MGIIYLLTHKESGRKYVGQTYQSMTARLNKHRNDKGCPYIHNAIAKYGMDAFEVKEVGWATEKDVVDLLETELIEQHQSAYPQGFNLRTTGQGVWHHEDTRKKIALKAKEQFSSVDARNASALARGAKPFTVFCRNTGKVLWSGVNKRACADTLKMSTQDLRNILNSPTRSSKGCVAKYDADPRPVLLSQDLAFYRQEICKAAASGYDCPTWQDLFRAGRVS